MVALITLLDKSEVLKVCNINCENIATLVELRSRAKMALKHIKGDPNLEDSTNEVDLKFADSVNGSRDNLFNHTFFENNKKIVLEKRKMTSHEEYVSKNIRENKPKSKNITSQLKKSSIYIMYN